ncbi:MAG: glutathione synthase [Gammaproteobacteria bacterium]|nr:glutathione synthase [Gammaproteobacteria bacterium]NNF49420.1 glutathione synthase [Woeseiaceae bacterium]MBT8093507.1 glutathione synthase [Gammaproteobacteria bacterium]MBT8106529.1 glutathione synthase [Gammaproteobacteria bacterium]NNK26544.1 glutathione synthase [Woeseiaceae bacterium]
MASNPLRIGIIMDPVGSITPYKDSSFAMLLEAQRRGAEIHYFEQKHVSLSSGVALGQSTLLQVRDNDDDWYELGDTGELALGELDAILMRKDPPFDMEYVYTTYILDRAEQAGALVVNAPQALRDMNEKAYTAWFPEITPSTLITRSMEDMKAFLGEHGHVVAKPLDGMGGRSIFVVTSNDKNANVVFETLTDYGTRFAMVQEFIPQISAGDKRILLIEGEPVPFALARIPSDEDNRGNIVAGAVAVGQEMSERDFEICAQIGPVLRDAGVVFAGIDIIGDCLTEVNVTSPTGIRELDKQFGLNIAGLMFDAIESRL